MNVLFYQHRFPAFGGIETVTTILAEQFQRHGYGVKIVSFTSTPGTTQLERLSNGTWVQLPDSSVDTENNCRVFENLLASFSPDIIIFQDSYSLIESLLWKCLPVLSKRPKVVLVEHNMPKIKFVTIGDVGSINGIIKRVLYYICPWPFLLRRFLISRKRRALLHEKCDLYLLLSEGYRKADRFISGCTSRCEVGSMANPIEIEKTARTGKKRQIVFTGALVDKNKGLHRLIKIWSKIWRDYPEWSFVALGDGPMRKYFEKLAERLHVGNMQFMGNMPNPRDYFNESSIFVMASKREGWPMVLGEAMTCGCVPIVYDSFNAVYDIIDSGINGFIVPCYQEHDYIAALKNVIIDEGLRSRMSAEARAKICNDFSTEIIFSKWVELLNRLVGGKDT